MAFKNELISEEDQKRIGYERLKDPYTLTELGESKKWTIDRERDAYLLFLASGKRREGRLPDIFLFGFRGERFRLDVMRDREVSDDPRYGIAVWRIEAIGFFLQSSHRISKFPMDILKEAFDVYGQYGTIDSSHVGIKGVRVDASKVKSDLSWEETR